MKILKSSLIISAFSAIFLMLISCHDNSNKGNDFLVKVDSIRIPSVVNAGVSFDIDFFGTIGFDGCVGFKTFNRTIKGNEITVETWGTFNDFNGNCPDMLVVLDGQKLTMTIADPGTYKIMIKEPGNYALVKQIVVN